MPRAPRAPKLSQAVDEFLEWLELDMHRSTGTVAEYAADLRRFREYVAEYAATRAERPKPRREDERNPPLPQTLRLTTDEMTLF